LTVNLDGEATKGKNTRTKSASVRQSWEKREGNTAESEIKKPIKVGRMSPDKNWKKKKLLNLVPPK